MIYENIAFRLCEKSTHRQHFHGVIVTLGGRIVATGFNKGEIHAEIRALKKMWPSERKGTKLYSFRFQKSGKWGMAKPCSECEKFIRESGVKIVYYTDTDGQFRKMKL